MHRKIARFFVICLIAVAVRDISGFGTISLPPTRLQTRYSGLSAPIYLTHAGDGSKRIFIVERAGIIRVVQPGSNTSTEFLNITALTTTTGERGLLSMAFHPQYETNRRFFVYFTRAADGAIQISEFETSPANPNVALTTEKPIITVLHPTNNNHNGGTLNFGADGYLYIATGDGGSGNDPPNNAQTLTSLLGKMLRIDINTPTGYLIPPTNPFAGATPGADEIYAYGLRNPFRWSVDRGGTNQIWLADVGQNAWEEVDIITSGGNYGWRIMEGNVCTPSIDPNCTPPAGHIPPVFVYSSQNTSPRCSITGGYVYRGTQGALPDGAYIYGDFCTGEILVWHNNQQIPLHDIADFNLVSFGEDEDGELYVVQSGAGIIQKLVPVKSSADFDADFRTDLSIFRPSNGTWYIRNWSSGAFRIRQFGVDGDIPASEDFDGDRISDIAVWRPSNGFWYFIRSTDSTFNVVAFGEPGDVPVAGDYDGDARADFVVFRPQTGQWFSFFSSDSSFAVRTWGLSNDVPVPGDYDGDGKYDITVWRAADGNWYTIYSTNGTFRVNTWGVTGDIPATGDFDGDGRNELTVYRPSTGIWYQKRTSNGAFVTNAWGEAADIPVVGDYDNDGRDDIAVWRPSNRIWYIIGSTAGIIQTQWGEAADIPVPSKDNP